MKWRRLGQTFQVGRKSPWWHSHAMAPTPIRLPNGLVRVFVGARDTAGVARIAWVDLAGPPPFRVVGTSPTPVLDVGSPGRFDDRGVFPASALVVDGITQLHYTGFHFPRANSPRYTMFGGLAISATHGTQFVRPKLQAFLPQAQEGQATRSGVTMLPATASSPGSAQAISAPTQFDMWYSAGSAWCNAGNKNRPVYNLFHQRLRLGAAPQSHGTLALEHDPKIEHGLGRPQVFKRDNKFHLLYTRRCLNMRYHFGHATSADGQTWQRQDETVGLAHGNAGWDSDMVYFPNILRYDDDEILFYNGNNFGETGFGCAILEAW